MFADLQNKYIDLYFFFVILQLNFYFAQYGLLQSKPCTMIDVQTNSIEANFGRKPGTDTIAYFKLEGDCNDYSGNSRNLTPSNISYETLSSGLVVAYLNGNSSMIGSFTEFGITELTINIRVKKVRNVNGECPIAVRDNSTYDSEISIRSLSTTQGNMGSMYYQNAMKFQGNYNTGISNGTRMNLMFTISTSGNKFYVNGNQVSLNYASGNANVGLQNAKTNMIAMGRHPVANADRFQGYVSQAIIEKRIRSQDEGSSYFNKTKSKYGY